MEEKQKSDRVPKMFDAIRQSAGHVVDGIKYPIQVLQAGQEQKFYSSWICLECIGVAMIVAHPRPDNPVRCFGTPDEALADAVAMINQHHQDMHRSPT